MTGFATSLIELIPNLSFIFVLRVNQRQQENACWEAQVIFLKRTRNLLLWGNFNMLFSFLTPYRTHVGVYVAAKD